MTIHSFPTRTADVSPADVLGAARKAADKIAPLWPLRNFVAVNPFLGLIDRPFVDVAQTMAKVAGAQMTMPRSFYAEAIRRGEVADEDLADALTSMTGGWGLPKTVGALKAVLESPHQGKKPIPLPTLVDAADAETGRRWTDFVVERISRWAGTYFDEGQALWPSPWRDLAPYEAWRAQALVDKAPALSGLKGFGRAIAALPETPEAALIYGVERLGLPGAALEVYFHRLFMTIGGWSSYGRYKVWQSDLNQRPDETLMGLLAIRLAWEVAVLDCLSSDGIGDAWSRAKIHYDHGRKATGARSLAMDCLLHLAYERAWQRKMIERFEVRPSVDTAERPAVQAAFCIDVRSEVLRRALEAVSDGIETIGFAGFFGLSMEYVPLGQEHGGAQCPVLVTPTFTVREAIKGDGEETASARRLMRRRAAKAWKTFKLAAVSSFGFVETMGLGYVAKLVTDSLGLTRPVPHPRRDGIAHEHVRRLGPVMDPAIIDGRSTGLDAKARLAMAESVLKAMSMTANFARLVVLAGHGASTVNNPHGAGLDCGACGGHAGDANARVAVAILNDPVVRSGLAEKGIHIPEDTVFVAALHDTTTDQVALFDEDDVPATHDADLESLKEWLGEAGRRARMERARLLGIAPDGDIDSDIVRRARDWSQVRPEWGLAGCATFVAAPRARTRGVDLGGRAFLHTYDWHQDDGFAILELIMTAPMVVASWISLQYYAAVVDNRHFGAGNKVLHNVVGTIGVLEGNGGDLRTGLPWQSVSDGKRLIHEPLRLNVVINAPIEAINTVIARHKDVAALVDNGWLNLFALDDGGGISARYRGAGQWDRLPSERTAAVA